ncbi:LysR family transcriptional regulator [Botrimarina hoheduenensis]|uniref:HTH-type transcriptional activator CmpR n=1 Tax=Botrimarina hoheduenensis TaxID=2528000 RepID=A0A5C5WA09_9BACT|nr:LysR family transcriptional regulator [Botrimarina hoheduenensis]TWT47444.1 HTH-type transcriptional activator CmpR [Botrimarina hoheduenensis]
MQLRSLKIFCDIVRLGSFSKAAELNGVSQPNVSQMVHNLEDRLGVQLIDRSRRPFVITPEGERYHKGCLELVQLYDELERDIRSLHDHQTVRLNIAAIYSVGLGQMRRMVDEFRRESPEILLRIDYMHPDQVQCAVESGDADIGVVSYAETTKKLYARSWRNEPFAVAVAPSHPLASESVVSVDRLSHQSLVMPSSGLRVRDEMDRWLASQRAPVVVALEFDNLESVKRAIEVGEGIGLLPAATFASEVALGSLVKVGLADRLGAVDAFVRPLGLLVRRDEPLSPAAQRFIELLQRHAGDPPDLLIPARKHSPQEGAIPQVTVL